MSLKFKVFVIKPFEEVVAKLVKHEFKQESQRLAFKKFRNKFVKELELFKERYTEIHKKALEDIEALDVEVKEEKTKEIDKQFIDKINELCECESELKPLDYNVVKEVILNQLEWDLLENCLENVPTEE